MWIVEVLEIAEEVSRDGIGKYRLIARSDEGGGIHGLCSHEHDSREEAQHCPEAIANKGPVTGVSAGGSI